MKEILLFARFNFKNLLFLSTNKTPILPVENLPVFLYCTILCLGNIVLEDLSLAREHYKKADKKKASI